MTITIVLAMHGAPHIDFPPQELAEFFNLHSRFEHSSHTPRSETSGTHAHKSLERYRELDKKMRYWPRIRSNDLFYAASLDMAEAVAGELGCEVTVGFTEFCSPTLDEAHEKAIGLDPGTGIVITPMIPRGSEHTETDIPQAVDRTRQRHAGITYIYTGPSTVKISLDFFPSMYNSILSPGLLEEA